MMRMSWVKPDVEGQTYLSRIRQYDRREAMILWVGAGLGGLVILVTSSLDSGAPKVFDGLVALLVIISGGSLAMARVEFEWASTKLKRDMSDKAIPPTATLAQTDRPWPKQSEFCWNLGRRAAATAAIVYLVAVWYVVFAPTHVCTPTSRSACGHDVGPMGPEGRRGSKGQQGPPGPRGRRGPAGRRGPRGVSGWVPRTSIPSGS